MAKKRTPIDIEKEAEIMRSKGLFDSTEPENPLPVETPKKIKPIGVAIKPFERDELDAIAKELGVTRHAVLLYAVRDFLRRWREGERPKTRAKMVLEN